MSKRFALARWHVDAEALTVTAEFKDGTKQTLNIAEVPEDIRDMLACHGAKQKGHDAFASAKNAVEEGKAGTKLGFAKAQTARVFRNLLSGIFSERGGGGARLTQLAEAVARVLGGKVEDHQKRLDEMSEDARKEVAKQDDVKAALATIRREAAERREKALREAADGADKTDLAKLFS